MAFDKIVDSAFLEAGLKKVGDSIRAKAGTSELLEFPDAMSAAVDAIDTSENLDDALDDQESLIDQIQAALEGKAAASVETCTVVVSVKGNTAYNTGLSGLWAFCYSEDYYIADVSDASLETGTVYDEVYGQTFNTWKYTVPNVVRNSFVNIISGCGAMVVNYSGASVLYGDFSTEALIAITAEAGGTARLELVP